MSTVNKANQIKLIVGGMVLGGLIMFGIFYLMSGSLNNQKINESYEQKKILYWVAPMDANYRRDKPGKSPMGMDLIPVYDNQGSGKNEGSGTVKISPEVVNNLGVRITKARYKRLQTEINTVGYITYDENKLIHIHPRVQGWVEKLYIKAVGDAVKKNQPLYDIYSPELVNAQEELLLAVSRKNQQLVDAAKDRLLALKFPLVSINQLIKDKKVQQFVTFYAPQQGIVKQLDIREGFYVKPETMMLSIVDLSEVWVKAEVFESQAALVSMGDKVDMTLDYLPNKSWSGQIEHIHPMINAKTRTAIVRLRFDNLNGELKPNMFAQISIHTSVDKKALLIPKEALIRTGVQNRVVLALDEGSFKSIAVSVGRFDSENVEIITGINEGDKIVSSAQFLLDSESSKTSDFKRMHQENVLNEPLSAEPVAIASATVNGTVVSVMTEQRIATIDREAIEKWGRKADTVDFIVEDNIDMNLFSPDAYVMFTFEIREGNFIIVSAMLMPKLDTSSSELNNEANGKGVE